MNIVKEYERIEFNIRGLIQRDQEQLGEIHSVARDFGKFEQELRVIAN